MSNGILSFVYPPPFAKDFGKEIGNVYFKYFIADNDHDILVVVIRDNAFAIKRLMRKIDFRASGCRNIVCEKSLFNENDIFLAYEIHIKLKNQCSAIHFVYDKGHPKMVEISYGFLPKGYDLCPSYWDKDHYWHEGKLDLYGWMVAEIYK